MDITQIQELTNWLLGIAGVGIVSLITSIIAIIRSGKMLPKDLREADLDNETKEIDLIKLYKQTITENSIEMVEVNKRLKALEDKVGIQEKIISDQSDTINSQSERLDIQERKMAEQDETIAILECKLENSEQYNKALIEQMQKEKIIPVSLSSLSMQDCSEISKKRKRKNKTEEI